MNSFTKRIMIFCGIISSVLYLGIDITASLHWKEFYDYTSQGFSELMAFEAPTRSFVLSSNILYNILIIVFGLFVRAIGGKKSSLRITGILLFGYAIVGIITPAFFPVFLRGVEITFRNRLHLPLTLIEVLFILSSMCFGAVSQGKRFRIYTAFSFVIMTVFAVWGGSFAPEVATNQPTPWLGVIERVNIYGYLLWVVVFALVLLQGAANKGSVKHKSISADR